MLCKRVSNSSCKDGESMFLTPASDYDYRHVYHLGLHFGVVVVVEEYELFFLLVLMFAEDLYHL